jgi:Kef-type K+ transport system membrane component KefB
VTRGRSRRRTAAWLFPTVGPDNDRVVPWWGPARALLCVLPLYAAWFWLLGHLTGDAHWLGFAPTVTGAVVVVRFCGRRKDGSKVRHRVLAVITACVLFEAVLIASVQIFPKAGHTHPGPLRDLVLLVAAVVAVYAFAAVTHWRGREGTRPLVEHVAGVPTRIG